MSELVVDNTHVGLRAIGPWLSSVLEPLDEMAKLGLETRAELAVHELASNSVDHANSTSPSFVLRARLDEDALRIELIDDGEPVEVESIPEPDLDEPQVRGYGMMIVEQLVSTLDYQRVDQQNLWTATFDLSGDTNSPTTP